MGTGVPNAPTEQLSDERAAAVVQLLIDFEISRYTQLLVGLLNVASSDDVSDEEKADFAAFAISVEYIGIQQ